MKKMIREKGQGLLRLTSKYLLLSILTVSLLLLAACHMPVPASSAATDAADGDFVFMVGEDRCSPAEARIIIEAYQEKYDQIAGIDLWEHDYGESTSLEDYVKDIALSQLANVYTLDVIATGQGYSLSESDLKHCQDAAKEFMHSRSSREKSYLSADQAAVTALFERYLLAYEFYNEMMGSVDTEVSDDEARVMQIRQLHMTDKTTADAVYSQLLAGGDILSLGAAYSDCDYGITNIDRLTFDADTTDVLFNLSTGDYSPVLALDGGYSIFYVEAAYVEALTDVNKEKVLEARKQEVLEQAYDSYAEAISSELDEYTWKQIRVDQELEVKNGSFLTIFQNYFDLSQE